MKSFLLAVALSVSRVRIWRQCRRPRSTSVKWQPPAPRAPRTVSIPSARRAPTFGERKTSFVSSTPQLSGDGEITARVDSLTPTDPWTKAGVMIRETLNANSRFAYTLVSAGNGVSFPAPAARWGVGRFSPWTPTGSRARRIGCGCVEPATCSRRTSRPTAKSGDSKAPASRSQWVRPCTRGSP